MVRVSKKVIIDTDPGIDDTLALLLALHSPELDVVGVTTAAGNVGLERTTQNALNVLDFCNKNIPVYKGAERPLIKPVYQSDTTHGQDGMGNIHLPDSLRTSEVLSAVDYLIEMGRRHPGELSLIALAPLTNIAEAILKDPDAMMNYKEIISMGGGIGTGNMSPVAEFNYWFDPEAAKIVYDFAIPITMVGLNVTNNIILTPTDFKFIEKLGGTTAEFINSIQGHYVDFYWENDGILGCVAHDPLAVAVACDPDIVQTTHCHVDIATDGISRGECVIDVLHAWQGRKNCFVATQVHANRFRDLFFTKLFPHGAEQYDRYKRFLERLN
jgi:purine nucleosidase